MQIGGLNYEIGDLTKVVKNWYTPEDRRSPICSSRLYWGYW